MSSWTLRGAVILGLDFACVDLRDPGRLYVLFYIAVAPLRDDNARVRHRPTYARLGVRTISSGYDRSKKTWARDAERCLHPETMPYYQASMNWGKLLLAKGTNREDAFT